MKKTKRSKLTYFDALKRIRSGEITSIYELSTRIQSEIETNIKLNIFDPMFKGLLFKIGFRGNYH